MKIVALMSSSLMFLLALTLSVHASHSNEHPSEFKNGECSKVWDMAELARDLYVKEGNCNLLQGSAEKLCNDNKRVFRNDFIHARGLWRNKQCGSDVDLPDHPDFPETMPPL